MGTVSSSDTHAPEPSSLHSASASPYPVAPPSAPPSSCPFLLSFARDASAQFSLCPFISLTELASLNASCRSWRQWMLFPPAVACGSNGGGRHWSRFRSTTLIDLANCPWARGLLTELRANPERRSKEAQASDAAWDAQRNAQAMTILRTLPRFSNLECLRLIPTFNDDADPSVVDLIRSCFRSLPRLARLKLSLDDQRFRLGPFLGRRRHGLDDDAAGSQNQHAGLTSLMQCVDELRSLRELTIDGLSDSGMGDVSFERLLRCHALRRLEFAVGPYAVGDRFDPPLQLSQISVIARCTQLESISCKAWHVAGPDPALALRRFVEVRLEAEQSNREASCASSSSSKPLLPVSTLTHLDLRTTDLQIESMLPLLVQFPALTDISPRSWTTAHPRASAADMAPHWAHLATFTQLRIFRLDSRTTAVVRNSLDSIIPQLSQCVLIQHLTLDALALSEAQLSSLMHSLKAIDTLALHLVQLESLDALTDVAALTSLSLHYCALPPRPRITLRGFVPRLPELLRLSILDSNHLRLTASKAAAQRAADATLSEACADELRGESALDLR